MTNDPHLSITTCQNQYALAISVVVVNLPVKKIKYLTFKAKNNNSKTLKKTNHLRSHTHIHTNEY